MKIPRLQVARVVEACLEMGARRATVYLAPTTIVRATHRHKPHSRERTTELVLTIGAPNARERSFIRSCKRAGEPFPVRKIQLQWYRKPTRRS